MKNLLRQTTVLFDAVFRGRLLPLIVFTVCWVAVLIYTMGVYRIVYIVDDKGTPAVLMTGADSLEEILQENGGTVTEADQIAFSGFDGHIAHLTITHGFEVFLRVDGKYQSFTATRVDTVSSLLKMAGIKLGEHDILSHPHGQGLAEGDVITVQRVEYVEEVEYEEIPYETYYRQTSLLNGGRERVLQHGSVGQLATYTRDRYVDGHLVETHLQEQKILKNPIDETILQGATVATNPDESILLDVNGNPIHYLYKVEGTATAYSVRPGAGTASGRPLQVGNVAVNPNVFPYGTKMYIKTASGSFIYGVAVAADTGQALMDGRVDVDLLFQTYAESVLFGRKTVEIYVLEIGNG